MSDGSAPFWGALLSILVFVVAFGRDMSSRFFKRYDEVNARLAEIESKAASNVTRIAQLENDLEDERTKTRRERDDKEAAERAAALARNERDTVKLENAKLDGKVKELTTAQATMLAAQETMRLEINEIKRDREERQRVYDLRLAEEQTLREKAEAERAKAEQERDEMRLQMQREIDGLKKEIAQLKKVTNGTALTVGPTTQHIEGDVTFTPTEVTEATEPPATLPAEATKEDVP